MTEYISRTEAMRALLESRVIVTGMRCGKTILTEYMNQCRTQYINTLTTIPAANVDIVKHGRWLTIGKTPTGTVIRKCSYCGKERKGGTKSQYCRDCGARMDLPELEGQMNYLEE